MTSLDNKLRPVAPGEYPCPLCLVNVQRTLTGTLQDGLDAHFHYVHPEAVVPRVG